MKIIGGITVFLLLVVFAGVTGPVGSAGAAEGESSAASKSPLKIEHLAFAPAGYMYLDGPRLEATCAVKRPGEGRMDDDGNVWFSGRCVVKETGLIRRFFGDDYWSGDVGVDEGPGSALLDVCRSTGLGQGVESWLAWGAPMKGGDKGFLLFSDGAVVRKVFKNPEKNDRWWFRKIIGGGSKPIPYSKGGTVPALDAKIHIRMLQVMPDGRVIVFADGGFYEYREEEKEGKIETTLVCLLGKEDYRDSRVLKNTRGGCVIPRLGVLGGDGTFYMGTYFHADFGCRGPSIWRVVPGGKVEPYAWAVHGGLLDGPAMASGAHCGHHFWSHMHNYKYLPPGDLYITAHDEGAIRRIRNGRVSTLCKDGEWREMDHNERNYWWFNGGGFSPGPDGAATGSSKSHSKVITCIVTGIDFQKPTVGPRIDNPIPAWPPEKDPKGERAKKKGGE